MVWTSRAAGRLRLQLRKDGVCWTRHRARHHTRGLLGGGQGSELGGREDHIPDGVVAGDAVTIATTLDLMVTRGIRSAMAFKAGEQDAVKRGH